MPSIVALVLAFDTVAFAESLAIFSISPNVFGKMLGVRFG